VRIQGGRRWHPVVSVRVRVLTSVLAMACLGVLLSGGAVYLVQLRSIGTAITASLEQEVAEFRTLAQTGVDPETGEPFGSIERLLLVALQRNVPDRNETYLTFLDGAPLAYNGGTRPIALEQEPTVLEAVAEVVPGGEVVIRDVPTSAGTARMAIVPVQLGGDPGSSGSFVMAYAMQREVAELRQLARIYALVSLVTLLLVGLVGWQVAGRLLRPLRTLRQTTQRISEADLSERIPVRGNDDLSELTRTVNDMLDRLEESIDTQRRFLDDAGHELRTPLTIVRGHLEVVDPDDPADVAATRALLLDEIDRIGRMVDDLILLSKSQRPDFLSLQPIDLAGLTVTVLDKARMLGDRRWVLDEVAVGVVEADPERLTQAMLELAANAVKFSAAGSTVAVGSALGADGIRLWVRDEGSGIAPGEVERIFGRFSRGGGAGAVDGSGLGLSIVETIATAHGGRVELDSAPGAGATFTIVLPAAIEEDGPRPRAEPGAVVPPTGDGLGPAALPGAARPEQVVLP
jgi:two-component system, OmpR family, sensor kinase